MSLKGVKILRGVRIETTGSTTIDRSYLVNRMRVGLLWEGWSWKTGDGVNHINERWKHLVFELEADELEHIQKNHPSHIGFLTIQNLLEDSGVTVNLYPDKDQAKSFEVIRWQPSGEQTVALFENGARTDTETLKMITTDKVTDGDLQWFEKNNNNYG